jgi:hypothetical protein
VAYIAESFPPAEVATLNILKELYEAGGGSLPDDVITVVKDRLSEDPELKKELKNVRGCVRAWVRDEGVGVVGRVWLSPWSYDALPATTPPAHTHTHTHAHTHPPIGDEVRGGASRRGEDAGRRGPGARAALQPAGDP